MAEETSPISDPVLRRMVETLREPVALGTDPLDRALDQAARDLHRRRTRVHILWTLALAASLALAIFGREWRGGATVGEGITFAVSAPDAGQVSLIGDFNDWDPAANPLRRRDTEWAVTLQLKPGRYRYSFVVDGSSWRADPHTPQAQDEFGAPTSVITVPN